MPDIRVGCSGWSYDDWVGTFYPPGTPTARLLESYAERFDTVEVNATYYRIPSSSVVRGWAERTPDAFLFSVKANRLMTHERNHPESTEAVNQFKESIEPLVASRKLACVLLQFPGSFRPSHAARDHLECLVRDLAGLPLVCEFRHRDWARESVKEWLRRRDVGYCCVDEPDLTPLMPRETTVTAGTAYLRFHGRNAEKWFRHEHAWERHDYLYTTSELNAWVGPARQMAAESERLLVYFNNHRMGQAPTNALVFRELLEGVG